MKRKLRWAVGIAVHFSGTLYGGLMCAAHSILLGIAIDTVATTAYFLIAPPRRVR